MVPMSCPRVPKTEHVPGRKEKGCAPAAADGRTPTVSYLLAPKSHNPIELRTGSQRLSPDALVGKQQNAQSALMPAQNGRAALLLIRHPLSLSLVCGLLLGGWPRIVSNPSMQDGPACIRASRGFPLPRPKVYMSCFSAWYQPAEQ